MVSFPFNIVIVQHLMRIECYDRNFIELIELNQFRGCYVAVLLGFYHLVWLIDMDGILWWRII